MIVTVAQSLFHADATTLIDLIRFVLAAIERRHVLLLDPEWKPADDAQHGAQHGAQPVQRLLQLAPQALRTAVHEKLEESLDEAATMGATVARIRVEPIPESQWPDGVLSREDALRLMQTPLWLVLENGRNDLEFLRRILEHKDRGKLDEHLAEGRVEVPLGGGTGELKAFLENLATLPNRPSHARDTTAWIRRLRSWTMFDRDAHPADRSQPSETSECLRALCETMAHPRPFPGHQLGRRTIENYLPAAALRRWADSAEGNEKKLRHRRLDAFMSDSFGAARRACFNMKEGFLKDVEKHVRKDFESRREAQEERYLEEHELPQVFRGCGTDEVRRHLTHGFTKQIGALYGEVKCEDRWFHKVFNDDAAAHAWRARLVESLWEVL